ncbi:MAG: hypothetical protein RLZZ31_1396 [Actinomycetota bacterium]|jgi:peptidylprolyl isomerase
MGTSKRERQKAGHQARLRAEKEMAKRNRARQRILKFGGIIVGAVAVVALFFALNQGTSDTTTASSTTSSTLAPNSAAGKPCVDVTGDVPANAPKVKMPIGDPPNELVVENLKEGEGAPVVAGDTVTVNYIGVSCSTGLVFDSSWAKNKPATFPLSGVIAGWSQGLLGMKPGGQRLLVIPPNMGYGSGGQGAILPDETLVFVVDLISAEPTPSTTVAPTTTAAQ